MKLVSNIRTKLHIADLVALMTMLHCVYISTKTLRFGQSCLIYSFCFELKYYEVSK